MVTRSISLQQVRISEPCPVAWGSMRGDDQRRFCSHCNLHVHNLSAMPKDEAQRLICESAGPLCVAYYPDAQGGVTHFEYAAQKRPRYRWRLVVVIAALGGCASALATAVYRPKPVAPAVLVPGRMMVAGMMAPLPPTTNPAACDTEVDL